MKYKLMMNDKCDNCGLCTGNEYISDESDGKPIVRCGIISEEQRDYVQGIVDSCPTQALTLTKIERISFDDCIKKIDKLVKEFHLEIPQENEFCYDKKYCTYSLQGSTDDEFQYIYDSRDEAKSAGCRSFERNILCNTTNCIRQILNNYSIDKLGAYLEYKECPGNFYYEAVKKAEQVLTSVYEAVLQVQMVEDYPKIESFTTISKRIADDEKMYWSKSSLDTINTRAVTLAGRIRRNTGERFRTYFEVDSMYVDVSTLFGTKEKKKYAFHGLYNATEEVRKDINSAVENNFYEYVQKYVHETVVQIVETFQELLIEEMKRKTEDLIMDVQEFVVKGSSKQSRKEEAEKVFRAKIKDIIDL